MAPYSGYDFSPTSPSSSESYTFDLSDALASGDSVVSATFSLQVMFGNDPNPNSHLVGSAVISGTSVSQMIEGLLPKTSYCVSCVYVTASGQTRQTSAGLPCLPDCTGSLS